MNPANVESEVIMFRSRGFGYRRGLRIATVRTENRQVTARQETDSKGDCLFDCEDESQGGVVG